MKTCAACGTENPDVARFCLACGTPLVEAPPAQDTRKVVTIVFSDLKGSTNLGERLDSEALREVMTRYFDAMRGELERHGGVIEKFIGDAVMAVFGLPRLHEDDALRAVRAAAGMQAALERLNRELELEYGVTLANRTGVNTGQVVAGDPTGGQRLVTGDAVNVAARLEQAAGEQEVLLGALTHRLVRDSVEAEEVEPLVLKGKSEPVRAYRLLRVDVVHTAPLSAGSPLVGRDGELTQLRELLAEARTTRSARLATIVGDAGLGKSRLTAEFLASVEQETYILRGRCLPYGDGITFWPLAEAIRRSAEIADEDDAETARGKLDALAGEADEGVADRLASAVGLTPEPFSVEELSWAVRRLLVHLARTCPVVFVVDDVHWAEETLLELLDQAVQSIDDAPVLVLCPTRPDLLERWNRWGTVERTSRIVLDPLDPGETRTMIEALLGGTLAPPVVERVTTAAQGNPLYAEQLLRMLTDEGLLLERDGGWHATSDLGDVTVPPSIQALLAARLDSLSRDERSVIEPAAVVGYHFATAAVAALAPEAVGAALEGHLVTLDRKQLVQNLEDGDDGMRRFHHIMIRDTAYEGILKRARADLHARFVAWADVVNQDRGVEFEEILGYHLEQAWGYLASLGSLDERARAIGADGGRRLAAAARRAFARGDIPGAASLFGRAAALLPKADRDRLALLPDYGEALLMTGQYDDATPILEEAIAHANVEPAAAARASLVRLLVRLRRGKPDEWRREVVDREIGEATAVFERLGDESGLAMAYRMLAWSAGTACRFGDAVRANEQAIEHARRAGDVRQERRALTAYAAATSLGPTNVDEAIARCEDGLEATEGNRQSEGNLLAVLGGLYAMQGSFDRARELVAKARALLEELGLEMDAARVGIEAWRTEMLAGDLDAAERELRRSRDALESYGERYVLSTVTGLLAQTLLERGGELGEAQELCDRSRELASVGDIATQALWRCAHGRILARRGKYDEAETSVREALELLEPTDFTILQLEARLDLGEVLEAAGRPEEAEPMYQDARRLAEAKGGVVTLGSVLRRLESLDAARA